MSGTGVAPLKVVRKDRPQGSGMEAEFMSGLKVLVVEDDPMLRQTLVTYLETKGFQPACVSSCEAAMKIVRALPAEYGVVVADLDLEGDESMALLRLAMQKDYGPRVIFLGDQVTQDRVELLSAFGAYETFEKPFVWRALAESVRRAAGRTVSEVA